MADSTPESSTNKSEDVPSKSAQAEAPVAEAEEAPNPDEDNLDELDDMLDQFSSTSISASGPGRPPATAPATSSDPPKEPSEDPNLGSDFSAQLQKEMAALLGEIDESPEMRRQLDDLMGELTAGAEKALEDDDGKKGLTKNNDAQNEGLKTESSTAGPDSAAFTDTIRRTMERMVASGEQADAAAAQQGSGSEEDMMARLLQDMASGAGGEASEEEFSKMLMGMMEQLTNKDILYEPMKDLDAKFPQWINEHKGKITDGDMGKYKEQQGLVREIVGRFERSGYSDSHPQDREFIVERMQKMQASGSPPADLVGDMKGAQDVMGDLGPECPQQ